jgi:hypothetical protein
MARAPRNPKPPPPEVQALLDEALKLTGGDMKAAIRLTMRKVVEDDAAAPARGALMRWVRRNFQHRWRPP